MNESPIDLVSAALVECQAKLKSAKFDASNPYFKSKYATLGSVIDASKQALAESGLMVHQAVDIHDGLVSVRTIIRHKSGQWLDGGEMTLSYVEPPDEDGKSDSRTTEVQRCGSLISYARRYAWSANLGVYSEEDNDGNTAPKPPSTYQRPAATQPAKPLAKADEATRMRALNFLQAAPGQPLRNLVQQFFVHKGWIKGEQLPEDWPLDKVPTGKHALTEIGNSIAMFERQRVDESDNLPFDQGETEK